MDSFQDGNWNILDYSIIEDAAAAASTDFIWNNNQSSCLDFDVSLPGTAAEEKGCTRKRGRSESCNGPGSKACREKMRRDRMNDRFVDLSSILEPGKPPKTDKSAILCDAIRVLNQLKAESQELKEENEKLQEDIKNLKSEKNELREEKLLLKADKEKLEQQVKAMTVLPAGFVPPPPVAYHPGANKMMAFPSYGGFPMWQWIPPAALDTSQDHVLRPPVA
ncbi:transcription factor bHLH115-like isoform X2 [Macadamia integrifolia]|uniref:transcription factor bHLH115-like isoform X2 n=1 Tax=Macadamia integrifolia TaxID=60698 RepID=UPI001C4F6EB6|nr:transcription factor bHLH115-like isoform X2 [Macadamia integrifolia]